MGEDLTHEESPARERGIGRRAMLKRAAAAGAVAWSAPVILDSLSSPAAAFSCGSCFKFTIRANSSQPTSLTSYPFQYSTSCLPNGDKTCSREVSGSLSTYGISFPAKHTVSYTGNAGAGQPNTVAGTTTNGVFNVKGNTNAVEVDIGTTASGTNGCTQHPTIIGVTFVWQNADAGGSAANFCESAQQGSPQNLGGTSTTDDSNGPGHGHFYGITTNTVTWAMPGSTTHAASSGAFNFVIGCTCS